MIAKILVITAFLVLLMYVLLPRRGGPAALAPGPDRRAFAALCLAAVLLLLAAAACAAFWLGSLSAGGQGNRVLLPMAAVLLALALACGLGALLKRNR